MWRSRGSWPTNGRAPPQDVFPYFTDQARYVQWMGSEATLEPEPGGHASLPARLRGADAGRTRLNCGFCSVAADPAVVRDAAAAGVHTVSLAGR